MRASTWRNRVPPEPASGSPASLADAAESTPDAPRSGCNCGRRRSTRRTEPLLTDDLVIAARDRAREPELPEATLARALATPITPKLGRYDVIILSGGPENMPREERLAAEFTRHEHRV